MTGRVRTRQASAASEARARTVFQATQPSSKAARSPVRASASSSGTLTATVDTNARRLSSSAAVAHRAAPGGPPRRRARAAARAVSGAPAKPRAKAGLRIASLTRRMAAEEIVRDEPGQEAVLDRWLDLLLITVLRAWFSRPEAEAPAGIAAHSDPVVGRALRMLHHQPARAWAVASLAEAPGVSRSALARRFAELVGEPPMTYLAGWRLALAAGLLRGSAL